ncbi:MAG: beta-lactamase family protein [Balneolaceae bacterium]|nr:beta-lactamase family protein [Balneolaceae bacterium]
MISKLYLLSALLLFLTTSTALEAQQLQEETPTNHPLDQLINKHYPADGGGATVLIQHKGKTLLKKAYGQINIEYNVPAQTDMKFRTGSLTKQFTAVSILMLNEQNKLRLSDDIRQHVPEYKPESQKPITIQQLLGHTAGIPAYENYYDHHGTERVTMDSIVTAINHKPLDFEPGTNWKYSNSAYILLGKVIENISRQSYQDFLQTHIFDPLRMKESSFYDFYTIVPGLSKGYEYDEVDTDKLIHAKAVKPGTVAAGGIISTLDDLAKWYDALASNRLITKENKRKAFTSQTLKDGRETRYGLGWWAATLGNYATAEHGGNNHGTEAYALLLPGENLRIIILSNINRSHPGILAVKLASVILDISSPLEQLTSLNSSTLSRNIHPL